MNRVRAGYCLVPNPFNAKHVAKISLLPDDVDALVFWSKNPRPMFEHFDELNRLGFSYYFLFTLNDYPRDLEPSLPAVKHRVDTFAKLSEMLGPEGVVWRYDPIIISTATPHEYHRERFERLSGLLSGLTRRVIVSIVDFYRKTDRRIAELEKSGIAFDRDAAERSDTRELLADLARTARSHGIEIQSCAQEQDFSSVGVMPGSCIDGELIGRLGRQVSLKKDPGQRSACRCAVSRDVGMPDTCLHGCRYCYATRSNELARRRHSQHDTESPVLWSTGANTDVGRSAT
jgi:DNA repair photolyase